MTLIYSIIQIFQARTLLQDWVVEGVSKALPDFVYNGAQTIAIVIAIVMVFFAMLFAFQAWKLYQEFGWIIYKKIGADLQMRRMYMIYQILVVILKFDFAMLAAYSGQYLLLLIDENDWTNVVLHSILSCGGFTVMLIIVFAAVRKENKWGMLVFFLADFATIGYFIAKLVQINSVIVDLECSSANYNPKCDRYIGYRRFLNLFISADVIMAMVTLGIAILALRNFGKGLAPHLNKPSGSQRNVEKPTRWEID